MTHEQIVNHPDKVALIEQMLEVIGDRTKHMYAAQQELEQLKRNTVPSEISRTIQDLELELEMAGLRGGHIYYCPQCRNRVMGKPYQTALGTKHRCDTCGTTVLEVKTMDPAKIYRQFQVAQDAAQAASARVAGLRRTIKRAMRVIKAYRKHGRPGRINSGVSRNEARASRSIDL